MIPCSPIPTWPDTYQHYTVHHVNDVFMLRAGGELFIQLIKYGDHFEWSSFLYSRVMSDRTATSFYFRWFRQLYPSAKMMQTPDYLAVELNDADKTVLMMQANS